MLDDLVAWIISQNWRAGQRWRYFQRRSLASPDPPMCTLSKATQLPYEELIHSLLFKKIQANKLIFVCEWRTEPAERCISTTKFLLARPSLLMGVELLK